jgi:hypothetical protein
MDEDGLAAGDALFDLMARAARGTGFDEDHRSRPGPCPTTAGRREDSRRPEKTSRHEWVRTTDPYRVNGGIFERPSLVSSGDRCAGRVGRTTMRTTCGSVREAQMPFKAMRLLSNTATTSRFPPSAVT